MTPEELHEAIFGSFDGLMTTLGVAVGLAASPEHLIVAGTVGAAAAGAVSMGAGEYLGDPDRSRHRAVVMGLATLVGTVLPVIPFVLFSKLWAFVAAGLLTVAMTWGIAKARGSYTGTFGVLIAVAVITAAVSTAVGGGS